MRVAILYYPMLFQRTGGLQVQVRETAQALCGLGVDAVIFDYGRDKLADFDVAHVFAGNNSNYRIVEQARSDNVPVVVSPVLHRFWNTSLGYRWATAVSLMASRLTGWRLRTTHREIQD